METVMIIIEGSDKLVECADGRSTRWRWNPRGVRKMPLGLAPSHHRATISAAAHTSRCEFSSSVIALVGRGHCRIDY